MESESERTEVLQGENYIRDAALRLMARARKTLDISTPILGPGDAKSNEDFVRTLLGLKERGVKLRMLTEINKDDIELARLAVQVLEVRHLSGLKATFVVSESEYLSSPVASTEGPGIVLPSIYSNSPGLVEQHAFIFERLWGAGEPAGKRITQLDEGLTVPDFEVIRDTARIKSLYLSTVRNARKKILLLLPTTNAFYRDEKIGVINEILESTKRGVRVRIASPLDQRITNMLGGFEAKVRSGALAFRPIPPAETKESVTVLVADDQVSLTIDEEDPSKTSFEESVGLATLAAQVPRLRTNVRFFERAWMESELRNAERSARQREEVSRRRAELIQDILTHDIRNFNQVARLNAELIEERTDDKESKKRISSVLRAIDGSTELIERTKKLGSILAADKVELQPVGLKGVLARSVSLVSKAYPDKIIEVKGNLKGHVLADGLLDEVFTNIITNSVKYTGGEKVRVKVTQEQAVIKDDTPGEPKKCWRISFTDWGRGIPESMKPDIFRRYLQTARGGGLGMSIIHALVTDRYGGMAKVKDRMPGDHRKGTIIEIWLPRP